MQVLTRRRGLDMSAAGRRRRNTFRVVVATLAVFAIADFGSSSPAGAIPITIVDDGGTDDEPGQKDLNQLTVDVATAGSEDIIVTWNWDVINVSGANTGDACSLYDTDNDGNANYSLCVIWNNGSTYETTRLYICGDGAADKCDQPRALLAQDNNGDGDMKDPGENLVGGPYNSTCTLARVADTFGARGGAQADTTQDTQASCKIFLGDFGGGDAFLTNVCSYPSQVPGSDPSDCVISPNSGFLTIVKVADPDDDTTFTFNLGAGQAANNGDTSFSIDGSGSEDLIGFEAGTTYDLSEVVPAGWQLDSAACELSNGTSTGTTSGNTVTDFEIEVGRETTCTFTNSELASLTLVKDVTNDNGGTAIASDWTLTADGTGANDVSGTSGVSGNVTADTFTLSESDVFGYLQTDLTCDGGTLVGDQLTLAAGDDVTCTFFNDDQRQVFETLLTVVKNVTNDNGGTAVAGDFQLSVKDGGVDVGGSPAAGSGTGTDYTLLNGTYDLSETGPAGYTLTSLTCDNTAGQVSSVTLSGGTVTCTFVNDDQAPSLTLAKSVVNDNGGTAVAGDFTLTATGYDALNPQTGTYDLSETGPAGYTLTSLTCDNTAGQVSSVTLGLGENVTCTFVNDDQAPSLTLIKIVENGANPGGTAVDTDWTLASTGPTGFSGQTGVTSDADFDAGTYDLSETGPAGYLASDWDCVGGNQTDGDTISIGLGEDVTCTITNTAMGMTQLLKLTNGVENQNMTWNFTLTGPGVDEGDSSPPTTVDFGGVKLIPGEEYTICEVGIPAGWTLEWMVDTDGDGVPDTIIPMVAGVNDDPVGPGGYSRVYDPNYVAPPNQYTNDTRCVNFVVGVGETLAFQINNSFPGGEPRTIGYWKNWNTCTGGRQAENAAKNGGAAAGWYILDDLLNNPGFTIGILQLDGADCDDAVDILDKRDIANGKKMASDAGYGLASQLLAAQLNLSAGAETCQQVVDAVNAGQALLASINFDGTGAYLKGGKNAAALRTQANNLAVILDTYNNGDLCSP